MLVTRLVVTGAPLSPLEIKTMTAGLLTVLQRSRELGGTEAVIVPT